MLVCSPLFTHGYLPSLGCWRLTQWRLPSLTNLTLPLLASYDRTSWCRGRGPLFCGCSLRIWWIIINVIRGKVALHDAFLIPLLSQSMCELHFCANRRKLKRVSTIIIIWSWLPTANLAFSFLFCCRHHHLFRLLPTQNTRRQCL